MSAGSLTLPIGSYVLANPQAGCQVLLNVYSEQARSGKQKVVLKRAPGISAFGEVSGDNIICRGGLYYNGVLYVVIGDAFYSVSNTGVATKLSGSTSILGNERVYLSGNNNGDVFIVTPINGFGYTWDGSIFRLETDPTFTGFGATNVGFIDGYFVFPVPNSPQFFNSGLNALTYNALDVAAAEGAPGNLVGFVIDHLELFLAKESTIEIWYDADITPGSPFSRSPNGLLQIGCAAGGSIVQQDNSIFWLANDKTIRRLDGGTPVIVSNPGVAAAIEKMSVISDCFGMAYTIDEHLFIAFTFPSESQTWIYDCTTKEWSERDSLGYGAWRPQFIISAYGKQIVGDSKSGKLGFLDTTTSEEWGSPMRCRWTYQTVYSNRDRIVHKRLELVLNSGAATLTGQGSNPMATLRYSDDGGMTWKTRPMRPLGKRGNYAVRVAWWQLGEARDRVYQIDVTDPVPLFVTDTRLDADGAGL